MANSMKDNPWTLDAAGATVLFSTYAKVKHFEWAGFAINQTVLISDQNGKEVWKAVSPGAISESLVRSGPIGWINGLVLTTLGGGTIKVYID